MPNTPNRGYLYPNSSYQARVWESLESPLMAIDADIQGVVDMQAESDARAAERAEAEVAGAEARLQESLAGIESAYDVYVATATEAGDPVLPRDEWLASLEGPQGVEGPYGGTEATDPQVATFLADGMATRAAVEDAVAPMIGVIDSRFESLQAAIDAAPAGGIVEVRENWTTTAATTVTKPLHLMFRGGSITTATGAIDGLDVSSNGVTITDAVIVGPGANDGTSASRGRAVYVHGAAAAAPLAGFRMNGGHIMDFSFHGVSMEYVTDSVCSGVEMDRIGYAGIIALSCADLTITGCTIRTITMPTPFKNAYGIALSRASSSNTVLHPRTQRVRVIGCTVEDNPGWEGFDTHAGEDIAFIGCTATRCKVGFACVPSWGDNSQDLLGPRGVSVVACTVTGIPSRDDSEQGIKLIGAAGDRATGVIQGCTIKDAGGIDVGRGGAIQLSYCDSAQVTGIRIERPRTVGVNVYYNNRDVSLTDISMVDVWTDTSAFTAGVYVRSTPNVVAVSRISVSRGFKTATLVNDRGFYAPVLDGVTVLDGGGHSMDVKTEFSGQSGTRKIAFYGAAPSVQPIVSGPKEGNTALTNVVKALSDLGLIVDRTS